jgi:hypothetical protein
MRSDSPRELKRRGVLVRSVTAVATLGKMPIGRLKVGYVSHEGQTSGSGRLGPVEFIAENVASRSAERSPVCLRGQPALRGA